MIRTETRLHGNRREEFSNAVNEPVPGEASVKATELAYGTQSAVVEDFGGENASEYKGLSNLGVYGKDETEKSTSKA